jgi:hypothetical protein
MTQISSKDSGNAVGNITVGYDINRGFLPIMNLIDNQSNDYELSCEVIFDKNIMNSTNKKMFELIVKAQTRFIQSRKEWGVTDFYFVGIGTFGFDIALGMQSLQDGQPKETFLASFGDFNARNIKSDVWYTLKVKVKKDYIQVFFNESKMNEKLVISYNIDKTNEKITDRYLRGEFESLQAIIFGLKELGITYPIDLANKVGDDYTFEIFKEEFASTLPVNGVYSGFRVFNDMTYITNVKLKLNRNKTYQFGSTIDITDLNNIISQIETDFDLPQNKNIEKVSSTINNSVFIQINDDLFYLLSNSNTMEKYKSKVDTFYTVDDKIIIVEKVIKPDSGVGINTFTPGSNNFVWSLERNQNIYNATFYRDLLPTIPNVESITITKQTSQGPWIREVGFDSISGDITGSNVIISVNDEVRVNIGGDRTVTWTLTGTVARFNKTVRAFQDNFDYEYPIVIKDRTFYKDKLEKYLDISDKIIRQVYINDNRMHLIFEDN